MRDQPPLLQLRAREAMIPLKLSDGTGTRERPIVEVLKDGEVLGQLPATAAVYEMNPGGIGKLTVTVFAASAEVSGHE